MSSTFHIGKLFVGKTFEIREGARVLGKGTITKLLDEQLQYWDYEMFFAFPRTLSMHPSQIALTIKDIQSICLQLIVKQLSNTP